jgi:hypothetical protein
MMLSKSALIFADSVEAVSFYLLNSEIVIFIASFVVSMILGKLFSMRNALQIIIHMVLITVAFPGNVILLYSNLIAFIQFDVLEQFNFPGILFSED